MSEISFKRPKVLVISNNCFSNTSSNGRTLGNYFIGWPKEYLAQFFLSGSPDYNYCNNFFQVSDREALNAIFFKKNIGGQVVHFYNHKTNSVETGKEIKRNAFTMLSRNIVWKLGAWKRSGYWKWVKSFNPDIVLLQAGDFAFLFDLARETALKLNAKLVIFNTEAYYYKNYDYFRSNGFVHFLYPVFLRQLRRALKKAYSKMSYVVYCCDQLKNAYALDFKNKAETIYTSSEIKYEKKQKTTDTFITSYCGNLGLKRHESLIEVANTIQEISSDLYVDVYGKIPSEEVKKAFDECKGIKYHGFVSYDQVKEIIRNSDLLLHVESFDEFYKEDLKFGFSTKIADYLCSGNCFLLYAPETVACYQYLKDNNIAYVAADKSDLKNILSRLVAFPNERTKYREEALLIAKKNHNAETNNYKFQNLLIDLMN